MTAYEKVVLHVEKLSRLIEGEFPDVDFSLLTVWITFTTGKNGEGYSGECTTSFKRNKMHIEMFLPKIARFTRGVELRLAAILIHEYCHYIDGLKRSAAERHEDGNRYVMDAKYKYNDERKTWNQTKSLALKLNLWSKKMYDICIQYPSTDHLEP